MVEAVRLRGATLRLGCPVIAVDDADGGLAVVLRGGERLEADVVIGADGKQTTGMLRTLRAIAHLSVMGAFASRLIRLYTTRSIHSCMYE